MSDISFILDNFKWSYSRLETYNRCPQAFYLQYVLKRPSGSGFFGEYGSFCHELLEKYFKNELFIFELEDEYVDKFTANVTTKAPPNKYVDLAMKYFTQGQDYFSQFKGLDGYKILGVEKKYNFNIDKYRFTGVIDLELQNKKGEYIILDHKTKSKIDKKKFGKNDNPEDFVQLADGRYIPYSLAIQLYLYSLAFKENYSKFPKYLVWNMLKIGDEYKLEFNKADFDRSIDWARDSIKNIYEEREWLKGEDATSYWCDFVCSQNINCKNSSKYQGLEI